MRCGCSILVDCLVLATRRVKPDSPVIVAARCVLHMERMKSLRRRLELVNVDLLENVAGGLDAGHLLPQGSIVSGLAYHGPMYVENGTTAYNGEGICFSKAGQAGFVFEGYKGTAGGIIDTPTQIVAYGRGLEDPVNDKIWQQYCGKPFQVSDASETLTPASGGDAPYVMADDNSYLDGGEGSELWAVDSELA